MFFNKSLQIDKSNPEFIYVWWKDIIIFNGNKLQYFLWCIKQFFPNKINLEYSLKSLSYIFSKFVCLQAQTSEDICDESGSEVIDQKSIWINIDKDFTWCDPYYVCALFSNGKHLPLPLVLGKKRYKCNDHKQYNLQNIVLSIYRNFGVLSVLNAYYTCMDYVVSYKQEYK